MNKLELSPLTPRGLARRVLNDHDHVRSENALVILLAHVRELAAGTPLYDTEALLRGLSVAAKPHGVGGSE